jgi:hypothetical protein
MVTFREKSPRLGNYTRRLALKDGNEQINIGENTPKLAVKKTDDEKRLDEFHKMEEHAMNEHVNKLHSYLLFYHTDTRLCRMVDDFSEKWSDKAQDPTRFIEVANEMKKLKKEISEYVAERATINALDQRLQKWEFEFYIERQVYNFYKAVGLPLPNNPLKAQAGQFTSADPSKLAKIHAEVIAQDTELWRDIDRIFKKHGIKEGIHGKPLEQSTVEEAEDKAASLAISKDIWTKEKNRILDYAIIYDAVKGGADKSIEDQLKDLKFIVRKKGERTSEININE